MRFRCFETIASIMALGLAAAANGQYAVNTYGPGQNFAEGGGYTVAGPTSVAAPQLVAERFTSAASGMVTNISLALSNFGGTSAADITLLTDNSGHLGTVLDSWSGAPVPYFLTPGPLTVVTNASPSVSLISGQNYWVEAGPGASDTWDAWNGSSNNANLLQAYSTDGGATWTYGGSPTTSGAFSVQVVPEPSPLVGLGLGLLPLLAFRRRVRR